MVSLQSSAVLPEATKRPPWLSLVGSVVASSTGTAAATSKKRKRDGSDDDRGEVVDGIELNFDAAPLPPEWQRCLDIKVRVLFLLSHAGPSDSIEPRRVRTARSYVCSVLSSDSCTSGCACSPGRSTTTTRGRRSGRGRTQGGIRTTAPPRRPPAKTTARRKRRTPRIARRQGWT